MLGLGLNCWVHAIGPGCLNNKNIYQEEVGWEGTSDDLLLKRTQKGRNFMENVPRRISLTLIAGRQSFSSFKIERQTVPEG